MQIDQQEDLQREGLVKSSPSPNPKASDMAVRATSVSSQVQLVFSRWWLVGRKMLSA